MPHWLLRFLICILVGLLVSFVLVMISDEPKNAFRLIGVNNKYRILEFLGISMGGVLIAIQATISHIRAKAMENAVLAQTEATSTVEKGQQQERLKNAIEHLGDESESVRLGGAYELLHLAIDVKELRNTVLDILCAHIRATTGQITYRKTFSEKPSEEVQSILTLLFIKEHAVFEGLQADLRTSWLNGVDLWYANLNRADLWKAHLSGAGLLRAKLQGAILMEADLKEAQLYGADLREALLMQSDFRGCELIHADLQGISADETKFQGAKLPCANLRGANLRNTRFQAADLTCVTMEGALLDGTNMAGAELFLAHLDGVASRETKKINFEERIRARIGKNADLSATIFNGPVKEKDIVDAVNSLSDTSASYIRKKLTVQVDETGTNTLPDGCDASTESYSSESAEKWICEYNKELSPKPDWQPLPKLSR